MRVTADVIRYEFVGREVKVAESRQPSYVGVSGKVIGETRNTFTVLQKKGRKTLVKDLAIFHFRFPDGTVVEIDGKLLVSRSEDRLKKRIRRMW